MGNAKLYLENDRYCEHWAGMDTRENGDWSLEEWDVLVDERRQKACGGVDEWSSEFEGLCSAKLLVWSEPLPFSGFKLLLFNKFDQVMD